MHRKPILRALAVLLCALTLALALRAGSPVAPLPGASEKQPQLIRIWLTSSVGGAESWLRACLRTWEQQHPGSHTYLRRVDAAELARPDAVLPDVLLFTPGDLTDPAAHLLPLSGTDGLREPLLRCGRHRLQQYGLPLCYGAYVLAVDGALDPQSAATPAPTTLLGHPPATAVPDAPPPGYPLVAALRHPTPLIGSGFGLMALARLLPEGDRPPLTPAASQDEAYRAFIARGCASALLTTGQHTAFSGLTAAGKGFPVRIMAPDEVITDQVQLAGLCHGASDEAAALLVHLTSPDCQRLLTGQGLHTTREDLRLYVSGVEAGVEQAAARSLTALNAFIPAEEAEAAAWRVWQGSEDLSAALVPLI